MKRTQIFVAHTWQGEPAAAGEGAVLSLALSARELRVEVEAPFHDDPPPPRPPGPVEGLWMFEVVELFLLGNAQRYLELELGPFGHYLVLQLRGARHVEAAGLAIQYAAARRGGSWTGSACVPAAYLPAGLHACNAYAMHGVGAGRRYLAAYPVGGSQPDFHRLARFRPIAWARPAQEQR